MGLTGNRSPPLRDPGLLDMLLFWAGLALAVCVCVCDERLQFIAEVD